jgi:hypothetical protein
MGLLSLPPIKAVKVPSILTQHQTFLHHQQHQRKKLKKRTSMHHYMLKMKKDESLKLRRLGSGLLESDVQIDSYIFTQLVVRTTMQFVSVVRVEYSIYPGVIKKKEQQ